MNLKIVLFFLVLAVVMTFPLAMHFTTAIAGAASDGFIHLYEMYWFRQAIFERHVSPLFNPDVFYPFGYNLALSHMTPSNTVPMMPMVILAGPVVAFNSAVLLSFVLSGLGAYLLVFRLTRNRWAGVLAGVLFAFSPYRFHNLGSGWLPNLGTQWLPFSLLFLDKLIARRTAAWRNGALAGFFFALLCLSSWYHVYIGGLAVALFVLARAWPWRGRLLTGKTLAGGLAFALVAGLMILPLALPLIRYGSGEGGIDWPLIRADDASASLDDLLLPSTYHPLWGDWALRRHSGVVAVNVPGMVYLGLPALALAAYAVRRRMPAAGAYLLVGIAGAVLTLGLTLHVLGERVYLPVPTAMEQTFSRAMSALASKWALNPGSYWPFRSDGAIPVPMPGMVFSLFVPFGSTMRVFHRFALDSSLGFAVLAGLGAAALLGGLAQRQAATGRVRKAGWLGRNRQAMVGALLIAVALADFAAAPLPYGLADATGFETDHWIAQQPGDFAVMHFPFSRGLNGPGLYRAAIHGKKITYGYGTFFPKAWLATLDVLGTFPSPESVSLLRSWNVRYVCVGQGTYEAGIVDVPGEAWDKVQQRLQTTPGLRYVRTFDEQSPAIGDTLTARLAKPWMVIPTVADRTHVYEILPP